jgi:hypothetical protein
MADIPLPRYQLPQASLPGGIDPASSTPPNILSSIGPGFQSGFGMGLQNRNMRLQEQVARQQQEQLEAAQKEKNFIGAMNSVQVIHKLPKSIRQQYWNGIVVPSFSKVGLNLEPGYTPEKDDPILEDAMQLIQNHLKDPKLIPQNDVMGGLHLLAMQASKSGDEETSKSIMDLAKEYKPSSTGQESYQFAGMQNNQPVLFGPKSQDFKLGSLPGTGTFIPKTEPSDIAKKQMENTESINILNDIENSLKGTSGIGGGGRMVASKLTAGAVFPEVRVYQRRKPALAVKLYRSFTNDTRLSDADALGRAMPLMPDAYEPEEVQIRKLQLLKDASSGRNDSLQAILTGLSTPGPGEIARSNIKPIIQINKKTNQKRQSVDGGKTWQIVQ